MASPINRTTSSTSSTSSSTPVSRTISDSQTQTLTSVLNNPTPNDTVWSFFTSSSSSNSHTPAPTEFLPINQSIAATSLSKPHFQPYLTAVTNSHNRFLHIQNHNTTDSNAPAGGDACGDALVSCLREVPALFFKEDFRLEEGGTFKAACPFSTFAENLALQEKLSQYLDVVEMHLVGEISVRSGSFYEAQRELEDLSARIVEGCGRIKELKGMVGELDKGLVGEARKVQELSVARGGLLGIQRKLKMVLYVNQAVSALKLLVASGDCAGALDITDVLQNLLDGDELTGLHCFRHLRDHVTTSVDSVNSILSAEFMRASIQDVGDMDVGILSKAKQRASRVMNGTDAEVKLDEEETSNFRDQLLPLIIGLLRTAKLPSVLRIYRDTLTTDMKTAIKNAVAELLPVLSRPLESDCSSGDRASEADGGHQSLANKLRSLSTESFVLLLSAIFMIVKAHLTRAAEVKKAIEWILCNLDGHYAAESVAAAIAHGASTAEIALDGDSQDSFRLAYSSPQKNIMKVPSMQGKANETGSPSNISKNFRTDVLRENTEAVFAACDAAQGRWAKLLGVRALLHPKLRLQEFLSINDITQEFITATEKIGGRLGYNIRGTLQSQAKAFVDSQHESKMAKLKAVLDQETWVEVDVPDKFQSIVSTLFCSESTENGNLNETQESIDSEVVNDGPVGSDSTLSDMQEKAQQIDANETPVAKTAEAKLLPIAGDNETSEGDRTSSSMQPHTSNLKEHLKPSLHTLFYRGAGYHMTNCGLILVKMLSEYIDINKSLPALSSEVVHRVVEILKFFNTRTCQLVLGAGALQVSGLKNINSKHLTLASQVISFVHAIIPEIRGILFLKVSESRKALLLLEIDRVAQDYKIHRDEIHTKLVQIMRERLLYFMRGLPQTVESWNRGEDSNSQPSQLAQTVTKQVGFLQRVLTKTLHEADVRAIFRQIVPIIHSQVSEAYSRQEISTPHAKERLHRDIEHLLGCIRSLPTDSSSDIPNWGQLDEFLAERFGDAASR